MARDIFMQAAAAGQMHARTTGPGPWRRDSLPQVANRRQRISEKLDEFTDLIRWYNSGIINLHSMIRLLKSINFVPEPDTILLLESRPVALHDLLKSFEKTYRPETKSVERPSTNFIEAMMSPTAPVRPAAHRKDATSQIRLALDHESKPDCKPTARFRHYDHGDIISWHSTTPEPGRRQIRRYSNRSSIVSNGSFQPRDTNKKSTRRHFDDAEREVAFQHDELAIKEERQPQRSPAKYQYSQPEVEDRSVFIATLDPNYKGARAPYGTDTDEIEALARISTSYDLQPPFDTDKKSSQQHAPSAIPRRPSITAWM